MRTFKLSVAILVGILLMSCRGPERSDGQTVSFANVAALRNQAGTPGVTVPVLGKVAPLDGKGGLFIFCDTCSSLVDNDSNFIRNPLWPVGRVWIKLPTLSGPSTDSILGMFANYMTLPAANAAIATMQADINSKHVADSVLAAAKAPQSRTLTINGTTYDLTANRAWTVTSPAGPTGATGPTGPTGAQGVAGTAPAYAKSGLLSSSAVIFTDTFSIATATPTLSFAAYLAAAGKSNFKIISADALRLGATNANQPIAGITAITSNSATFQIQQQNTAVVTLVGVQVLSGLPLINVTDPANTKLIVSLILY